MKAMIITIRSQWLLHRAFGFKPPAKRRAISLPVILWWECFLLHGWRNWQRGYRDEDAASLTEKLSFPPPYHLTRREQNVFDAWYRKKLNPRYWGLPG